MKAIIQFFINRPLLVNLIMVLVFVVGFLTIANMRYEYNPKVDMGSVNITLLRPTMVTGRFANYPKTFFRLFKCRESPNTKFAFLTLSGVVWGDLWHQTTPLSSPTGRRSHAFVKRILHSALLRS